MAEFVFSIIDEFIAIYIHDTRSFCPADEEWLAIDDQRTEFVVYALGFTIVERVGFERLRSLCASGSATPDTLLVESGLAR